MKTRYIVIDRGKMHMVYDDSMKPFMRHGQLTTARASHVEPGVEEKGQDPTQWYADMSPSGASVILGPFPTRQEALKAEESWLNEHLFGSESAPEKSDSESPQTSTSFAKALRQIQRGLATSVSWMGKAKNWLRIGGKP